VVTVAAPLSLLLGVLAVGTITDELGCTPFAGVHIVILAVA